MTVLLADPFSCGIVVALRDIVARLDEDVVDEADVLLVVSVSVDGEVDVAVSVLVVEDVAVAVDVADDVEVAVSVDVVEEVAVSVDAEDTDVDALAGGMLVDVESVVVPVDQVNASAGRSGGRLGGSRRHGGCSRCGRGRGSLRCAGSQGGCSYARLRSHSPSSITNERRRN